VGFKEKKAYPSQEGRGVRGGKTRRENFIEGLQLEKWVFTTVGNVGTKIKNSRASRRRGGSPSLKTRKEVVSEVDWDMAGYKGGTDKAIQVKVRKRGKRVGSLWSASK